MSRIVRLNMTLRTISRRSCEWSTPSFPGRLGQTLPNFGSFFGDTLVTIEGNSIGGAATAEMGRRGTRDEEEGMWPLHNLYRLTLSLGAEGSIKTVHLNPFVEWISTWVGRWVGGRILGFWSWLFMEISGISR